MSFNCVIMGAAGRDFHDFQTFFRRNPQFRVRAFTATQIPDIEFRSFPKSLAGPAYDADIPIHSESRLADLIDRLDIDQPVHRPQVGGEVGGTRCSQHAFRTQHLAIQVG